VIQVGRLFAHLARTPEFSQPWRGYIFLAPCTRNLVLLGIAWHGGEVFYSLVDCVLRWGLALWSLSHGSL